LVLVKKIPVDVCDYGTLPVVLSGCDAERHYEAASKEEETVEGVGERGSFRSMYPPGVRCSED
jgi:hypothetical protein